MGGAPGLIKTVVGNTGQILLGFPHFPECNSTGRADYRLVATRVPDEGVSVQMTGVLSAALQLSPATERNILPQIFWNISNISNISLPHTGVTPHPPRGEVDIGET